MSAFFAPDHPADALIRLRYTPSDGPGLFEPEPAGHLSDTPGTPSPFTDAQNLPRTAAIGDRSPMRTDPDVPPAPGTLAHLCERFLENAELTYLLGDSPTGWTGTLTTHLKRLCFHDPGDGGPILGDRRPAELTRHHVEAIQRQMARCGKPGGKPYSKSYVKGWRQYTLQALDWLADEDLLDRAIAVELRASRPLELGRTKLTGRPKIRPVPDAELDALIAWCLDFAGSIDGRRSAHPRAVGLALRFIRFTGCRPKELATLSLDQIEPAPGHRGKQGFQIYKPTYHKTSHKEIDRWVVIPPDAGYLLEEADDLARRGDRPERLALAKSDPAARLWPWRGASRRAATDALRKDVYRCCEAAGLPEVAPNRIRHRFGTWGTNISRKGTQGAMGHQSMTTTDIYDEKEAEEAMAMFEKAGLAGQSNTAGPAPEPPAPDPTPTPPATAAAGPNPVPPPHPAAASVPVALIAAMRDDAQLRRAALAGELGPDAAVVADALQTVASAAERPNAGGLRLSGGAADASPHQLRLTGA